MRDFATFACYTVSRKREVQALSRHQRTKGGEVVYSEEYLRKAEKRYEELYYKGPLGYTDIPIKNTNILVRVTRLGQSSLERVAQDRFDVSINSKMLAQNLTEREMVIKLIELGEEK